MCRIVVRVTFIQNMLMDNMSHCGKSYIHKNVLMDDMPYCGES